MCDVVLYVQKVAAGSFVMCRECIVLVCVHYCVLVLSMAAYEVQDDENRMQVVYVGKC